MSNTLLDKILSSKVKRTYIPAALVVIGMYLFIRLLGSVWAVLAWLLVWAACYAFVRANYDAISSFVEKIKKVVDKLVDWSKRDGL